MRRRHFLGSIPLAFAGGKASGAEIAKPLEVTNPRATSGDRIEPEWQSGVIVTVGPQKADLVGTGDKVIQAAVDYVAGRGGGTVHILPGEYRLRNAVYLQSRREDPRQRRRICSHQRTVRQDEARPQFGLVRPGRSRSKTPRGSRSAMESSFGRRTRTTAA